MSGKDPLNIIHLISVILFLLIYLVKTGLLLANKKEPLAKITRAVKIPEMIISLAFLVTGIMLLINLPEINALHIIKISMVLLSIPIAIVGFKKGNKILATLAFLMIVGSYGLAEVAKKKREKGDSPIVLNENTKAEDMYAAECTRCHGTDGKAGMSGATDLSTSMISHDSLVSVIRDGRGTMPSFTAVMKQEQIEKIAIYVESLRSK
jgi:hypothetical protein